MTEQCCSTVSGTEYCCHAAVTLAELAQARPPLLSGNPHMPGTVAIRVGQGVTLEDAQQQLSFGDTPQVTIEPLLHLCDCARSSWLHICMWHRSWYISAQFTSDTVAKCLGPAVIHAPTLNLNHGCESVTLCVLCPLHV